jgi:hypothetical protein
MKRQSRVKKAGSSRRPARKASSSIDRLIGKLDELVGGVNRIVKSMDGSAPRQAPPPLAPASTRRKPPAPLARGRAFRLAGSRLVAFRPDHIRPIEQLYGYADVKSFFSSYFEAFAAGQTVPPLLLSGLPGLGKTHFTMAYTLAHPQLTLVAAEEKVLVSGLEDLVQTLGAYRDRRFVLFFDDVNAQTLDWTSFRHQVGGMLALPSNLAIVVASNFGFPGAIRSRCTNFEFRPMDAPAARSMICGYLQQHLAMAEPRPALLDVMTADFVEQYVNGPLEDLTARSLIGYFEALAGDEARRQRLMDESLAEMVREPDEDAFVRSNQRVMEQMQRSGAWQEIRKVRPAE